VDGRLSAAKKIISVLNQLPSLPQPGHPSRVDANAMSIPAKVAMLTGTPRDALARIHDLAV